MIRKKKKDVANKRRDSVLENPKCFWSFIKSATKINQKPSFLRDSQAFVRDSVEKANVLNRFFNSVFTSPNDHMPFESTSNQSMETRTTSQVFS